MNDSTELKTCGLEMKGGYHGRPYPQKFVRCAKSDFPGEPPAHPGKEVNANDMAMKMSMGR